jgi:uncharacterized protein (TIGR00251 family)
MRLQEYTSAMKCRLELKVVPGASRTEVSGWLGQCLKVKVTAAPEKGKANQAVIRLLSEILAIRESAITIVSGANSQRKAVEINGFSRQELENVLPSRPA